MSIWYLEMVTKTLDELCRSPVNLLSAFMMCGELSITHRVLCDVEGVAGAMRHLGMMCGLDCPWLSPFLFASLGGWVAASRGELVIIDSHRDCWEPGETRVLTSFLREYVRISHRNWT